MWHDVVDAFLQVGNLVGQACYQSLGNLSKKDATLGARIKELCLRASEQLLRQHVQHLIGKLWRREHFVVAQVCQARQHIGVVVQLTHSREVLDSQSEGIRAWAEARRLVRPNR